MKICVEKLIKKSKKKKRGVEPQNRATTTTTTIQYLNTFGDCHPAKPLGKKSSNRATSSWTWQVISKWYFQLIGKWSVKNTQLVHKWYTSNLIVMKHTTQHTKSRKSRYQDTTQRTTHNTQHTTYKRTATAPLLSNSIYEGYAIAGTYCSRWHDTVLLNHFFLHVRDGCWV